MPDPLRTHHPPLPHGPTNDATYFITWRLQDGQPLLNVQERELIVGVLRHFDRARYGLLAFVVMDDHVHVLLQPFRSFALEGIAHSWKSYSAHVLQKHGRNGSVWARGYSPRIIRNESDYEEKLAYIRTNPQRRWPGVSHYPWVWYNPTGA
jgi:REP element-mobilizing transposase RayT